MGRVSGMDQELLTNVVRINIRIWQYGDGTGGINKMLAECFGLAILALGLLVLFYVHVYGRLVAVHFGLRSMKEDIRC